MHEHGAALLPLAQCRTVQHGETKGGEQKCGGRGGYFHNFFCEIGAAIHHGLLLFVMKVRTSLAFRKDRAEKFGADRLRRCGEAFGARSSVARRSCRSSVVI